MSLCCLELSWDQSNNNKKKKCEDKLKQQKLYVVEHFNTVRW